MTLLTERLLDRAPGNLDLRGGPELTRLRSGLWICAIAALTAAGAVSLDHMDAGASNGYGLISVFPLEALACLGVLTCSFVVTLRKFPKNPVLPLVHVVAEIFLLYGAAPLSEKVASWAVAWYTAGFVNQVATTGHVLLHTDARWSWPGFFSGVAALMGPAGVRNADQLLLWAPVALAFAYLAPVLGIARSLVDSPRVQWLAVWVFFVADWTGQEYFSPQGLAFLLFLTVMAIVLRYFGVRCRDVTSGPPAPAAWRPTALVRWLKALAARESLSVPTTEARQASLVVVVLAVLVAIVVSHQLTPVALFVDFTLLALLGRLTLRRLPVFLAAALFIYISYFATDFWAGHLAMLFGVSGGGAASLSQNVGGRVVGSSAHKVVVVDMLAYTLAIWCLAGVGVLRRLRRSSFDLTAILCLAAPLCIPVVQPYGGEGIIRAYLYGLPFAATLAAVGLCPRGTKTRSWVATAVVLLVAVPSFIVANYGNEQFEQMRPNEVVAYQYFYRHAKPGSELLTLEANSPGPFEKLGEYSYRSVSGPMTPANVVRSLRGSASVQRYLLLTKSGSAYGTINAGLPPGWEHKLERELLATSHFRVVFHRSDATLLEKTP